MILDGVKKVIVLNAGHHDGDTGAISGAYIERDLCKKVRDEMLPLLSRAGFTAAVIPDSLTLSQSIAKANEIAPSLNDALCLDLHFNYATDVKASGVEAFHGTTSTSKQIAQLLSARLAATLGLKDRGAKPSTSANVGELGWIRQTKAWATLVEVAFISNAGDMAVIHAVDGFRKAALGIVNGLCELYGLQKIELDTPEELAASLDESIGTIEGALGEIRSVRDRLT